MFGVSQVPMILEDDQYDDFFRLCKKYIRKWKSTNRTSTEMLFLQLLSYYTGKLNTERFVISVQTRMPLLKNGKKKAKKTLVCQGSIVVHLFYH